MLTDEEPQHRPELDWPIYDPTKPCPKCGNPLCESTYESTAFPRSVDIQWNFLFFRPHIQRMSRRCGRCSYQWFEVPLGVTDWPSEIGRYYVECDQANAEYEMSRATYESKCASSEINLISDTSGNATTAGPRAVPVHWRFNLVSALVAIVLDVTLSMAATNQWQRDALAISVVSGIVGLFLGWRTICVWLGRPR